MKRCKKCNKLLESRSDYIKTKKGNIFCVCCWDERIFKIELQN